MQKKMAKISKEEYELLESLGDYWKWIARDSNTSLWAYEKEPIKHADFWDEGTGGCGIADIHLFQFIQWEDEEPYNIQELLEEYEKEGEETEVKDIEWLRNAVLELQNNGNTEINETEKERELGRAQQWAWNNCVDRVYELINQLDELEVKKLERKIKELDSYNDELIRDNNQFRNELDNQESLSREFIDKKAVEIYSDTEDAEVHVVFRMRDLQNLLVPKQELPVIPSYVAEWIEKFIEYGFGLYPALKRLESNQLNWKNIYEWYRKNTHKFVNAYLTGKYEVETEQKYYVDLDTAAYVAKWKGNDQVDIYTDGISGSDEYEFHLTEREIKDYDERFWPFRKPVEELEENGKD